MVSGLGWLSEDYTERCIRMTVLHWWTKHPGVVRGISADKEWLWLEFEDGWYEVRRSSAFVRIAFANPVPLLHGQ